MGQPNAGKTSFTLNFAAYLGVKRLQFTIRQPEGFRCTCSFYLPEAREKLVSAKAHETINLQSITLSLPLGKRKKTFQLVDSCGLRDGIHPQKEIRQAMSQTIRFINQSSLIFHLIDPAGINGQHIIDDQINAYARNRPVYCILANKVDRPVSRKNLPLLKERYPETLILPISARSQEGFQEIKIFLMKNL